MRAVQKVIGKKTLRLKGSQLILNNKRTRTVTEQEGSQCSRYARLQALPQIDNQQEHRRGHPQSPETSPTITLHPEYKQACRQKEGYHDMSPQWGYTQHHCHLHLRTREVAAVAAVGECEEGSGNSCRTTTVREAAVWPPMGYQSGFGISEEWVG